MLYSFLGQGRIQSSLLPFVNPFVQASLIEAPSRKAAQLANLRGERVCVDIVGHPFTGDTKETGGLLGIQEVIGIGEKGSSLPLFDSVSRYSSDVPHAANHC